MKVLIVEPREKPRIAEIANSLEAKQAIVGGLIEMVIPPIHPDDAVLICNEESKILSLEPNKPIRLADGSPYDIICGTFLICRAPVDSEDFAGLTDQQVELYSEMYS